MRPKCATSLQEIEPTVILMDVSLPDANGLKLGTAITRKSANITIYRLLLKQQWR